MDNSPKPENSILRTPRGGADAVSSGDLAAKPLLAISTNDKLVIYWSARVFQKAGTRLAEFQGVDPNTLLLFVNRGKLSVTIDGNPVTAHEGQALVVMPGERCVGTEIHEADLSCQWINFRVMPEGRRSNKSSIPVWRVSFAESPTLVSELLRLITEEFHQDTSWSAPLRSQGSQLTLLALLSRLKPTQPEHLTALDALTVLAERARDYMRANPDKHMDTASVARHLECSPGYLRTAFRRTYGYTPQRFLLDSRMYYARYLLVLTRKAVGQIAVECGYTDHGYFTRVFTRENGVTPTQYRIAHSRQYMTQGI